MDEPQCNNTHDRTLRRSRWRWRNKYLDLIQTKPELIIAPPSGVWGPAEHERFSHLALDRRAQVSGIVVELGSGSGQHLITQARTHPEVLFIGFELRFKRAYRTAEKAERLGIKNLLVLQHDARSLGDLFPQKSLAGVYINFPDPWSKRQWLKHRMLTLEFLGVLASRLQPGGFFSYKTDHRECFDAVVEALPHLPFETTLLTRDLYSEGDLSDNVPTEFEGLFRSQNLPIHHLRLRLPA